MYLDPPKELEVTAILPGNRYVFGKASTVLRAGGTIIIPDPNDPVVHDWDSIDNPRNPL